MPRPRTVILRLLAAFAVVVLLVLAGLAWLTASESGLRWAWARAEGLSGGLLRAERVEGTLLRGTTVSGLSLELPAADVRIDRARLVWTPAALLRPALVVQEASARGVHVALHAAPEEAQPAPAEPGGPFAGVDLPLPLVIEQALIESLVIEPPEGEAQRIDRVELAARAHEALHLERLVVAAPLGRAALSGRAALRPEGALDLAISWRATPPGMEQALAGEGRIEGTLARPELTHRLLEPVQATLQARAAWMDPALPWSVRVQTDGAELGALGPDLPPLTVTGSVEAEGEAAQFQADGDLTLSEPEFGRWNAQFQGAHRDGVWRLARLEVDAPGAETRLSASGRYDPGADEPIDLDARWQALTWPPLTDEPLLRSESGELSLSGRPEAYSARLDARLAGEQLPPGHWQLEATGDTGSVQVQALRGQWLGGTLAASGSGQWVPAPAWDVQLAAENIDPGALLPEWPGRINGKLASRGQLVDGAPEALVELRELDGTLRELPVSGTLRAAIAGESLRVDELELRSGQAQVSAAGTLEREWSLDWRIDAPRLGHLLPDAAGRLSATGRLEGPRGQPAITARAEAAALAWQELALASLALDADLRLAEGGQLEAQAQLSGLRQGETVLVDAADLSLAGTTGAHTLNLALSRPELDLSLRAAGAFDPEATRWRGELADIRLQAPPYGDWRQRAPAALSASPETLDLAELCLAHGAAGVCLEAARDPAGVLTAQARATSVSLDPLAERLSEYGVELGGLVDAAADVTFAETLERLDARVALRDGQLAYLTADDARIATGLKQAEASVRGGPDGLRGEARLALEEGGSALLEARLPQWEAQNPLDPEQPVQGRIEADFERFDWLALVTPAIADPRGRLEADLSLTGDLGRPRLAGSAVLADGRATLPAAGVTLEQVRLTLRSRDDALFLEGGAQSGPGRMTLEGRLAAPSLKEWQLDLAARGERFEVMRLPHAHVFASPDLRLDVRPGVAAVTGTLSVPQATIRLPELPPGAVQPSADVVIVDTSRELPDPEPPPPGWETRAELRVVLGEEVRVEGFGFTGRIDGRLDLNARPNGLTTASGELNIEEGIYEAYGQRLDITRGQILYSTSPLENPGLDLRAVRKVEEVTAGVHVTGRLQNPRLELFSNPTMEESNVLSYLLIGRPLGAASQSEGSLLYRAATSLGFSGGDRLAKKIGGTLGLDEVELQSENGLDEASLILGRRLSPQLYLRYAIGIGETISTLQLRYELSERLALEAESGETAGVDLFYTQER